MLTSVLQRRRKVLMIAVVLVVFVAALVAWTHGPANHDGSLPDATRLTQSPAPLTTPPSTAARGGKTTSIKTITINGIALPESVLLNAAGASRHSVILTATGNGRILRLGYLIAGGHPDRGGSILVSSPVRITTEARGDGAVAVFAVQAAPETTFLQCSITVDGHVRTTRVVRKPWGFAYCLG